MKIKNLIALGAITSLSLSAILVESSCLSTSKSEIDRVNFSRGSNNYSRGRHQSAVDYYLAILESSPDSIYWKGSILALADSYYKLGDFAQSSIHYQKYVELYPVDRFSERAQFYLGASHYLSVKGPQRDQSSVLMAIEVFTDLIERYPTGVFADKARELIGEMRTVNSESEYLIAKFYYRINQNVAAISRLSQYILAHPESDDLPEASYMLAVAYHREGAEADSARVLTELLESFPDSKWARRAEPLAREILSERAARVPERNQRD